MEIILKSLFFSIFQDDIEEDGNPPPSQPPPSFTAPTLGAKVTKDKGNTLNLGMAQIIVTAATPMVEDGSDKSFPPVEDKGDADDDDDNAAQNTTKPKGGAGDGGGGMDDDDDNDASKKKQATKQTDIPQIIEGNEALEAVSVTITLTSPTPNPEDLPSSDQEHDSSEVQPLEEAEDPFNEKANAAARSDAAATGFEANFEANFDANFDDAFANAGGGGGGGPQSVDESRHGETDVDAPKQVVGGRASIPEELDSNQLARLQNLKESNA